jgi:hypothetical protein
MEVSTLLLYQIQILALKLDDLSRSWHSERRWVYKPFASLNLFFFIIHAIIFYSKIHPS